MCFHHILLRTQILQYRWPIHPFIKEVGVIEEGNRIRKRLRNGLTRSLYVTMTDRWTVIYVQYTLLWCDVMCKGACFEMGMSAVIHVCCSPGVPLSPLLVPLTWTYFRDSQLGIWMIQLTLRCLYFCLIFMMMGGRKEATSSLRVRNNNDKKEYTHV